MQNYDPTYLDTPAMLAHLGLKNNFAARAFLRANAEQKGYRRSSRCYPQAALPALHAILDKGGDQGLVRVPLGHVSLSS